MCLSLFIPSLISLDICLNIRHQCWHCFRVILQLHTHDLNNFLSSYLVTFSNRILTKTLFIISCIIYPLVVFYSDVLMTLLKIYRLLKIPRETIGFSGVFVGTHSSVYTLLYYMFWLHHVYNKNTFNFISE